VRSDNNAHEKSTPAAVAITLKSTHAPTGGKFDIDGRLGVPIATVKDCGTPSAALKSVPAAMWATKVQRPTAMKLTFPVSESTEHTVGVERVTDLGPSPVVDRIGVNEPPTTNVPDPGKLTDTSWETATGVKLPVVEPSPN